MGIGSSGIDTGKESFTQQDRQPSEESKPQMQRQKTTEGWDCKECHFSNQHVNARACRNCHALRVAKPVHGWTCRNCDSLNQERFVECIKCGSWQPGAQERFENDPSSLRDVGSMAFAAEPSIPKAYAKTHINELPDDALVTIFLMCDADTINSIDFVCKMWLRLAQEVYRHMVTHELLVPLELCKDVRNWRKFYMNSLRLDPKKCGQYGRVSADGWSLTKTESRAWTMAFCTRMVKTGKFYFELHVIRKNCGMMIGVAEEPCNMDNHVGYNAGGFALNSFGDLHCGNHIRKYTIPWEAGDRVGCLIDKQSKSLEFFVNGDSKGRCCEGEISAYETYPAISVSGLHDSAELVRGARVPERGVVSNRARYQKISRTGGAATIAAQVTEDDDPEFSCPHMVNDANFAELPEPDTLRTILRGSCQSCASFTVLICTACHEVHCSRSAQSHMSEHCRQTGHPIAFDIGTAASAWCYECSRWVNSSRLAPYRDAM
eukprot:TRINITY_DN140_c0_g1_i4.p1 TRINITY_DN140_c0_g1~~TRINITY_DN140_c0_g1_i4.p1  ORF type:complete len:490 (+),score=82.57 TRINITY_DN140_c0_g1_i4:83-1552(+)